MPDPDKIQSLLLLYALALADERIAPEEMVLLHKIAMKKGVTPQQLDTILFSPAGTINPDQFSFDGRITLLYDAVQMMIADGHIDERELAAVRRCSTALQFSEEQAEKIITLLLAETDNGTSADEILIRVRIQMLQ